MPHPLSTVKQVATFSVGLHAVSSLGTNPELAALAMQAIGSSSNLEALMMRLFITILGGSATMAANVYLALESAGPKAAAIAAAARSALTNEQQSVLAAVQKLEFTNRKSRDKLAHHTWAHSAELPNALLLIDPRALTSDDSALDKSLIDVYTRKDFVNIINANNRVCELAQAFRFTLLSYVDKPQRDAQFAQLLAAPEIRDRLQRQASQGQIPPEEPAQ